MSCITIMYLYVLIGSDTEEEESKDGKGDALQVEIHTEILFCWRGDMSINHVVVDRATV